MRTAAPGLLVLVLALPALAGAASAAAVARVELAEAEGVWNGVSCATPAGDAGRVLLWVPPGARVHGVLAGNASLPWRASGRDALSAEAPGEACAHFDFDGRGPVLARYVAPRDADRLDLSVLPPGGRVAQAEGVAFARPTPGGPFVATLAPLREGDAVTLRVVDAGRVGELSLLATVGGLAVLSLAGALLWHKVRPPLRGREPERFLDHLVELQARLVPAAAVFAVLNVVYFTMGLRTVDVAGWPLVAPVLGVESSVAARAFEAFAERLVPPGVTLVALRPVEAVLAQVQTALFLAFLTALPLILYELAAFLGPGLEPRERRAAYGTVPLLAGLFLGGALFGYLLMAPLMIRTLYAYAGPLGALPLLAVGDLVSFALLLIVVFGLAFELPVVMYALARLGIVRPATFGRYFRHAVLVIVVLAGLLTPDPSVVSQLLVAGPVTLLYLLGLAVSHLGAARRARRATA